MSGGEDAFFPLGPWHLPTHFVWSQCSPKGILLCFLLLLFTSPLSPALPAQPALSAPPSYDGEFRLPLVLAQASPIFHSSCEGKLGIALE